MLPDILKAWGMDDLLSRNAVELLTIILQVRPKARCSIENMMAHAWLQGQNTGDKRLQVRFSVTRSTICLLTTPALFNIVVGINEDQTHSPSYAKYVER